MTSEATSASTVKALPSDGGGDGGKVGIGASVALNIVDQHALAQIGDDATVPAVQSIALSASSEHDVTTEAKSGSKGDTAVTPALAWPIRPATRTE